MYVGGYRMGRIRIRGSNKEFPLPNELETIMNTDGNGRIGRLIINYILLATNQVPIVIPLASREQYLAMMENNDVDGLAKMFTQLQEQERARILDFLDMDKEDKRQLERKKNSK